MGYWLFHWTRGINFDWQIVVKPESPQLSTELLDIANRIHEILPAKQMHDAEKAKEAPPPYLQIWFPLKNSDAWSFLQVFPTTWKDNVNRSLISICALIVPSQEKIYLHRQIKSFENTGKNLLASLALRDKLWASDKLDINAPRSGHPIYISKEYPLPDQEEAKCILQKTWQCSDKIVSFDSHSIDLGTPLILSDSSASVPFIITEDEIVAPKVARSLNRSILSVEQYFETAGMLLQKTDIINSKLAGQNKKQKEEIITIISRNRELNGIIEKYEKYKLRHPTREMALSIYDRSTKRFEGVASIIATAREYTKEELATASQSIIAEEQDAVYRFLRNLSLETQGAYKPGGRAWLYSCFGTKWTLISIEKERNTTAISYRSVTFDAKSDVLSRWGAVASSVINPTLFKNFVASSSSTDIPPFYDIVLPKRSLIDIESTSSVYRGERWLFQKKAESTSKELKGTTVTNHNWQSENELKQRLLEEDEFSFAYEVPLTKSILHLGCRYIWQLPNYER